MIPSDEQQAIIDCKPTLNTVNVVKASAGSGKSQTMAFRTKALVEEHKISTKKILLITFSNRAARDLRLKVKEALNLQPKDLPTTCTIHSMCLDILRLYTKEENITLTDWQNRMIFRDILEEELNFHKLPKFITNTIAKRLADKTSELYLTYDIDKHKDELNNTVYDNREEYEHSDQHLQAYVTYRDYYHILEKVNVYKRANDVISFSDIVYRAFELLRTDKEALTWVQKKYIYVTVDEAQDLTVLYWLFCYNVFNTGNTTIVGDTTQWLYSFAYADYSYFDADKFRDKYKTVNEFSLSTNYRSAHPVVTLGNILRKFGKSNIEALPAKHLSHLPKRVSLKRLGNQIAEVKYIVSEVKKLIKQGEELSDIYVITRTNKYISTLLEPAFLQENIPYIVQSSKSRKLSDKKEILFLMNMLMFVTATTKGKSFIVKSILQDIQGIGKTGANKLANLLDGSIYPLMDDDSLKGKELRELLTMAQSVSLGGLEVSGMGDYIEDCFSYSKFEISDFYMKELKQLFTNWATIYIEDTGKTLEQVIPDISTSLDSVEEVASNSVRLTNVHQCLSLDNDIKIRYNKEIL